MRACEDKPEKENLPGKTVEVPGTSKEERLSISLNKNQVKPGGYVLFRINIPKSYKEPKIQTFECDKMNN